jgi:hypothetical protein
LLYEFGATADEISCSEISLGGEQRPYLGCEENGVPWRFLAVCVLVEGLGNRRA